MAAVNNVVLVVDDDGAMREVLYELVSELGCLPFTAENGRVALDMLAKMDPKPSLVLLDWLMPLMSGQELLEELKKSPSTATIPVTIMSASRTNEVSSGGVLHKPFTADALQRVLRTYCACPADNESSVLSRIAVMLRGGSEYLIQEWVASLRRDVKIPQARVLSEVDLRNNIPDVIEELIFRLTQMAAGKASDDTATNLAAKMHARQRVALGYTLAEEMREMGHLRQGFIQLCTKSNVLLADDEAKVVHAVIDDMMSAAVLEAESATYAALRTSVSTQELFASILAHDLRTPLGAVTLVASRMLLVAQAPAQVLDCRRILGGADRMRRLIDNLLDLTRTRSGGLPFVPRRMNLGRVCEDALEEMRTLYPQRIMRLDVVGVMYGFWDPDRLMQLLSNLIGNAVDYSPVSSVVLITARECEGEVLLKVHNDGEPIAPDLLASIFDPFQQGDASAQTGRHGKGLGLGLYIAQQIALVHGGNITVTSDPGAGTTFDVRLPRMNP